MAGVHRQGVAVDASLTLIANSRSLSSSLKPLAREVEWTMAASNSSRVLRRVARGSSPAAMEDRNACKQEDGGDGD